MLSLILNYKSYSQLCGFPRSKLMNYSNVTHLLGCSVSSLHWRLCANLSPLNAGRLRPQPHLEAGKHAQMDNDGDVQAKDPAVDRIKLTYLF